MYAFHLPADVLGTTPTHEIGIANPLQAVWEQHLQLMLDVAFPLAVTELRHALQLGYLQEVELQIEELLVRTVREVRLHSPEIVNASLGSRVWDVRVMCAGSSAGIQNRSQLLGDS